MTTAKRRHHFPLDILECTVTASPFVVVERATYGHGVGGWRIAAECLSLESANAVKSADPLDRHIYQRGTDGAFTKV